MNKLNAHTCLCVSVNYFTRVSVIIALLMNSGCFYFIEEGTGGVAERFPVQHKFNLKIDETISRYSERLEKCQQHLAQMKALDLYQRHPVRFHDISNILVSSKRMHQAQFYVQANDYLQQAETLLSALQPSSKSDKHVQITRNIETTSF